MEVQSVPDIVAFLVGDLRPLEDALDNHVGVHGDDAEPENVTRPALGQLEQRCSKRCFTQGLPYQGTT